MSMRLPCQLSPHILLVMIMFDVYEASLSALSLSLHILLVMIMFDVYEASLSILSSYSISYDYV